FRDDGIERPCQQEFLKAQVMVMEAFTKGKQLALSVLEGRCDFAECPPYDGSAHRPSGGERAAGEGVNRRCRNCLGLKQSLKTVLTPAVPESISETRHPDYDGWQEDSP